MAIPIYGYRDVWSILIDSLLCIRYPYWGIFSSHLQDFFGQWYEDGWLVSVVYLMTLISDLNIGAYFPIFFEYPWDWDNGQLGFRLSASLELPTIDCIRTPYMDLLRYRWITSDFTWGAWVDPLARCSWDRFVFVIVTLQFGLSRWAVFCALEIYF